MMVGDTGIEPVTSCMTNLLGPCVGADHRRVEKTTTRRGVPRRVVGSVVVRVLASELQKDRPAEHLEIGVAVIVVPIGIVEDVVFHICSCVCSGY